jgi:hypothetical protein
MAELIKKEIYVCSNCGAELKLNETPIQTLKPTEDVSTKRFHRGHKNNFWTKAQIDFIREQIEQQPQMSNDVLKRLVNSKFNMNVSYNAVKTKRNRLQSNRCVICNEPLLRDNNSGFCLFHLKKQMAKEGQVVPSVSHKHKPQGYTYRKPCHTWRPEWMQRLNELQAEGKTPKECARLLSQQFQLSPPITAAAVYNAKRNMIARMYCLSCGNFIKEHNEEGLCLNCMASMKSAKVI